jgi:hypothetical protein
VDATILEAQKRTAAVTYEGPRGDQPLVVVWTEQDLILHDEFRDGNVPASCRGLAARDYAALCPGRQRPE